MGLRTYRDGTGTEWRVWDVPPRFNPLRAAHDRRSKPESPLADERRTLARRITIPPAEWIHGWLCFQSDSSKLRLCPLPARWEQASPEKLELLRRQAVLVRPSR